MELVQTPDRIGCEKFDIIAILHHKICKFQNMQIK